MTYIGKLEPEIDSQTLHEKVVQTLQSGENPRRPYLFKHFGFHFEQEVRFVVRTNPKATFESKGMIFRIRAKDVINHFNLSADIPYAEQHCIEGLARECLEQEVTPGRPHLSPFSAASEPQGVFRDLETS